ncbi:MAG: type II secretion system F family protein [Candidatus Omnitrophica bacterium]|nr:type II secretion system F family protein [Candidatus Omnitrophota bacterium]MDD5691276.1 type II secretion system F family protein [Candidatus Omnitrophota bacterium]
MPNYQYKCRDKFSKETRGVMEAESEDAVAQRLIRMGFTPVSITEEKETGRSNKFSGSGIRIKFSELNMFTRQLATLQKAGLPILLSLNALAEQAQNKVFKEVIGQIIRDIESGSNLSGALEKYPRIFNNLYLNMVASGEAGGRLDDVLERLASLSEHDETIRLRIKSSTRYPIIVVVAMIIGFVVLTVLVVPRYAKIYAQYTTALPLPTQMLLWVNYAVTKLWWLLIIIGIAARFLFKQYINTKIGRFTWDSLKLKVPVFGPLLLKLSISRFTRITGTLMRSGIPILKILDISSGSTGNEVISKAITNIRDNVIEGKGIAEPMKVSGLFPPIVTQMVLVGEQTGKLDDLLIHVSNYYDEQVDYTINNLTSLIEPILIFVLGLGVLFMALGIFLPMWNLMSIFKK